MAQELDYNSAQLQIERELDRLQLTELPLFKVEKGETCFSFRPAGLPAALIIESLQIIKNHIEHVRIHTFENGYIVFQGYAGNMFDPASLAAGTKFKFSSLGGYRIDVVRRGNFHQEDLQAALQLFTLFSGGAGRQSPLDQLRAMGVQVFLAEESGKYTFDQLAGYNAIQQEVEESIILPYRHADHFAAVARLTRGPEHTNLPRAILLEGPPGVGKTSLARIIAGQTGLPLVHVPVENIVSKYYGESAQNMARIFELAGQLDQVLLFLDEIDSLTGSRDDGIVEASRRVLSVLLRKIDGLDLKKGTLTIGATNRKQDLDRALMSRFVQTIAIPLPDAVQRAEIYGLYAPHLNHADRQQLAQLSEGLAGRNIKDICEFTERRWARMLLEQKSPPSVPPARIYEEITEAKKMLA